MKTVDLVKIVCNAVGEITPDRVKTGRDERMFPVWFPSYSLSRPNYVEVGRDRKGQDPRSNGKILSGRDTP